MAGTGEAFVLPATVFGAPGPPFSVQDRRSLPRDHRSLRRDQRICAKIVDPCRGTTGPSRGTSVFRPKSLVLAAGPLVLAAGSLVLGAGTLVPAAGTLVLAAGTPFFGEDRSSLRRSTLRGSQERVQPLRGRLTEAVIVRQQHNREASDSLRRLAAVVRAKFGSTTLRSKASTSAPSTAPSGVASRR